MTALVLAAIITTLPQAGSRGSSGPPGSVGCGGFPLDYGTAIGAIGPSRSELRARSIIAVAAITPDRGDLHARAWMVWDERGTAWLAIAKNSPNDLRQLWSLEPQPSFAGGVSLQVRFSPMTKPLPPKYRLVDCPDAKPFGSLN
jgi:hypothetical protein